MTNPEYTAIQIIVDRSGSMESIRSEMQTEINRFIADQAIQPGKCTIRLSQFDGTYELLYSSRSAQDVPHFWLQPRGATALYDAIGTAVNELGKELEALTEARRPGKVLVVVITDGHENASHKFSKKNIKELIQHQKEVYKWEFVFMGANQNAVLEGNKLGIDNHSGLTYDASGAGVRKGFQSLAGYTRTYRGGETPSFG